MKTQQTDNPRIKTIHDESGDYAVIDNSMIVQLDSTTRPPDDDRIMRQALFRVTEQRDELLAALKTTLDHVIMAVAAYNSDGRYVEASVIDAEDTLRSAIAKCEANK